MPGDVVFSCMQTRIDNLLERPLRTRLFACVALLGVPFLAHASNACDSAAFHAFYAAFLDAAKTNDRAKIAASIAFPVTDWSTEIHNDVQIGPIKDRADFLRRYDVVFPPSLRSHLAQAKVEALEDGRCFATWSEGEADFALGFARGTDGNYRATEFQIGPM